MQDILTCAMGLDVHRDIIVACLVKGELGTDPEIEIPLLQHTYPGNAETAGLGVGSRVPLCRYGKHRNLLAAYLRDAGVLF